MGWQEDLRRLDVDLAEGRISHEAHRRQRDDLLAGASGGVAPSPLTSPLRRPTEPMWHSVDPAQEQPTAPTASPKPPPFKPAAPFATNRRTTAPSPADQRATDSLPYPRPQQSRHDAATVVRPAVMPPPPPPPPLPAILNAARQQAPSQQLEEEAADSEPEKNRQRPVWLFVSVGVLLVAALIAGGSWWLLGPRDQTGQNVVAAPPPSSSATPAPSTSPQPTPEDTLGDSLPTLPGSPNPNNGTMPIEKGQELGLYPAQSTETFLKNGASQVTFRGSAEGDLGYLVMIIPTGGPDKAKAVVEALYKDVLKNGFSSVKSDLRTAATVADKTRVNVTWYASGDKVVSVGVSQPTTVNQATLTKRREQTVNAVRDVLAPS